MAYYDYSGFRPYVSVGARRAQAARELAKLKKKGRAARSPRRSGAKHGATTSNVTTRRQSCSATHTVD